MHIWKSGTLAPMPLRLGSTRQHCPATGSVLVSCWPSRSNVQGGSPDRLCPSSLCREDIYTLPIRSAITKELGLRHAHSKGKQIGRPKKPVDVQK